MRFTNRLAYLAPRQKLIGSKCTGILLAAALGAVLLGAAAPGDTSSHDPSSAPATRQSPADPGHPKVPVASSPSDVEKGVPTRLIPDVKTLLGSPPTVIDLADAFQDTEIAEGGEALDFEVSFNEKEKHAKATIDGSKLTLEWGSVGKTEITLRVCNSQTGKCLRNKFQAEVWEPDYWKLVLTVIGGLGIFLLGMKNMSEGLQAVAGAGLRRMIGAVTDNRLMAAGVGTLVTCLIQSSSITTVMVVGFVNSGFMTLAQACGVIMGANIGTTITGWILVLKIGKYGLPLVGAGAFVYLFSRRDRVRYLAMALMGLGMVFLGLEIMKNGFAIVKNLPAFESWFQSFSADTYLGVLKCASVGCVLTCIVQSSSATLGITISLAVTGVIPFETGAALVLGENIGTTITAWLASLGATTNAKRAAYFHMMFNMLGVLWITAIFLPRHVPFLGQIGYVSLVEWIVGTVTDPETGRIVPRDVTEAIAVTHTLFNVTNTILFLPLVRKMATLLEWAIPERAAKEEPHLTSLDVRMLETSVIAIEQSRVEVLRMGHACSEMTAWLKEILTQEVPDQKLVEQLFHREELLDRVQDEIVAFMAHLVSGNLPHDVTDTARLQLRMVDEYESVSDYLAAILKSHLKLVHANLRIPEDDFQKLLELHDMVAEYLAMISRSYEQRESEVIALANSKGQAITRHAKELRHAFLTKMSDQKQDAQVVVAYNAQLNSYRRVREHALNIAEALAGVK